MLDPAKWVNDEAINFYMRLILVRGMHICATHSPGMGWGPAGWELAAYLGMCGACRCLLTWLAVTIRVAPGHTARAKWGYGVGEA